MRFGDQTGSHWPGRIDQVADDQDIHAQCVELNERVAFREVFVDALSAASPVSLTRRAAAMPTRWS